MRARAQTRSMSVAEYCSCAPQARRVPVRPPAGRLRAGHVQVAGHPAAGALVHLGLEVCVRVYVYLYMYVCVCMCVCVYVCMCMCVLCMRARAQARRVIVAYTLARQARACSGARVNSGV